MYRRFTLPFILTVCAFAVGKVSFATNYVNTGAPTTYNLISGDSVYFASGTYTGTIGSFPSGAKITVSSAALFSPTVFPNTNGNSAAGIMNVYGTFSFSSALITNTDFTINNYGVVSLAAVTMKGSGQVWTNYSGSLMNISGDVLVNSNLTEANTIINYGIINISGSLTMTTNATITNYKNLTVGGEFKVSGGTVDNQGKLETIGQLTLNNALIYNRCRMISSGGIKNTSSNLYNYSYLWARNDLGLGNITNTGNIYNISINGSTPMIHGKNLTNSGFITGNAFMYFYGTTAQTGGFTGISGPTTDTIKMYDITRFSPSTIYDNQAGTVYPNTIYNAWGVPDSTRIYALGCSVEISLLIPLAINWNSFEVSLSKNISVLDWSAEFERGTIFEIQRSYDGRNFSAINALSYEVGQSEYEYEDRTVNTQAPIVYYRIKAVEISGVEKYTQTRIVKFNSKQGNNLVTAPNPFNNNFIINYQSSVKEMITIRMFNVSGQQQLTKQVPVNSGVNIIKITEAAQLPGGIYIVQVNNGSKMISSGKIIKQ